MQTRLLFLGIFLATLTPSLGYSQSRTFTNCHTPESSGNFVGADETIVNGMVCKVVTTQLAQQQIAANRPAPPSTAGPKDTSVVPGSVITNSRVVELSKLGLDDDIVIAKIRNGSCRFQLGDSDLVELKKAGVSSKVITAMLDSNTSASAPTAPSAAGASM